jgi:Nif-specific regulatory protein
METMVSRARPIAPPDVEAPTSETRRLSTLLEVSQAFSGTLNLKASMHRVLEVLARHHGAVRGIVSVLHADGELRVEASDGLDDGPRVVSYRVGRVITGRVVQTSRPIVVPRVSREPSFLHRAARRPELSHQELSFVCVPILLNRWPSARSPSISSSNPSATSIAARVFGVVA